jgi:hypothetical protein
VMFSDCLKEYAERKFEDRKAEYERILPELERGFSGCTEDERLLMQFFYGTMPLSDAGEYDFETFLGFVRHGLMLRRKVEWCRTLPEDIFVKQVLYYRINSEKIENCRPFFYEKIRERIRGMSMEQAVLEINYWAAEHVSYRASDERTLSPMTVYRSGDGRCGEESAFLVSVLRAAGIPSRQVYVPVWAHCDDNHAWVEVRLADGWHYLGACEPEEVLDRGWFDGAASRAMLIHAREFSDFSLTAEQTLQAAEKSGESLGRENGVCFINRTAAYAETSELSVCILDDRDQKVPDAEVRFSIVNYAAYSTLAVLHTGKDGTVRLRIGRGTVQISAHSHGYYAEQQIDIRRDTEAVLRLLKSVPETEAVPAWKPLYFKAPAEKILHAQNPTEEQKRIQQRRMGECAALREAYLRKQSPAEREYDDFHRMVMDTLSEKDRKDVTEEIFTDAECAANEGYPDELFKAYVLSQRIGKEELTPFRREIRGCFTEEQLAAFRNDPEKIADYLRKNISYDPDADYPTLVSSPGAVLRLRWGSEASRSILLIAIARTLQLPARLDPVDGEAEYYDRSAGNFRKFNGMTDSVSGRKANGTAREQTGKLKLQAADEKLRCGQNWTISSWDSEDGVFRTLPMADESLGDRPLSLPQGIYRILTSSREPGGNQHVERLTFMLKAGGIISVPIRMDTLHTGDRIVHYRIDDFPVTTPVGKETGFLSRLADRTLAVFLDPGKEPSEHVLNEILEAAGRRQTGMPEVILLIRDAEQAGSKSIKEAAGLPGVKILIVQDDMQSSRIARKLYVDPDKLPLLMLLDGADGNCIYGSSGYNVGSVALALEIADIVSIDRKG